MSVRVVVIGTGIGARVVAPSFTAAGAQVVDVVSARDRDAAVAACRRADVDLVSIHAPPFLHRELVEAAHDAGHLVLCDKPFGRAAAEAEAMATREGWVNLEFRFHPCRALLRELVSSGRIGVLEHISWVHYTAGSRVPLRRDGWLFDAGLGGGWVGAWGAHVFDAIRWIAADEVIGVAGFRRQAIGERPDHQGLIRRGDAEDGFTVALTLHSGATVAIDSTFAAPRSLPSRVELIGSEGVISVVADESVVVRGADGTKEELVVAAAPGDPHLGPMQAMAANVVAVARGEAPHPDLPTFADGLACRIVEDRVLALPLHTSAARPHNELER